MWMLLYILLNPNSPELLQDIQPVHYYYSQKSCMEKVEEITTEEFDSNVWLACIPVKNLLETKHNDH